LAGIRTHVYRDGKNTILSVGFSNENFRNEYIESILSHAKEFAKKCLPYTYTFLANAKRIYRRVKRP
jgi:tRNA A37 threonylcarbamoyladenosine synthetase subunit TsaC/SUA5/YrdC